MFYFGILDITRWVTRFKAISLNTMGNIRTKKLQNACGLMQEHIAPCTMRSSNIELLRIVAMLAIIAHHYVVNSTAVGLFDPMHPTENSMFLQLWGMWGKTAI